MDIILFIHSTSIYPLPANAKYVPYAGYRMVNKLDE